MKKLVLFVLVFCMAVTAAFAARNLSLNTGKNSLPVALDAFPAFKYGEPLKQIDLWLWFDDVTKKDAYIKELQKAGFKNTDDGTYTKGNAEVWFDDSEDQYAIAFSIFNVKKAMGGNTLADLLKAFPAFKAEQFGTMYSVDFALIYNSPMKKATLDGYIKALNAAGFAYNSDDKDYQKEIGDEKLYYFEVADNNGEEYYNWSVLYY